MTAKPTTGAQTAIAIDAIVAESLAVPIIGTSPLIVHRFSEKSKLAMLDAMQGRKTPKSPKNPQAEYEAAFYRMKGEDQGYGFPASAFKMATVGGARFYPSGVTMTSLRSAIFMRGEPGDDGTQLFRIEGEPRMREDVVRVGRGGTDLRYRPQFDEWRTSLLVTFVPSMLTRSSVLSLIDAGGLGVGVGEWRPEKSGDYGTFQVDPTGNVEVLA